MKIRLQKFGYRDSRYERPNQKWVCGWAGEGHPCKIGPDGRGNCSAKLQSECRPIRKGDRWYCARPAAFGGPCEYGPLPDGSCCRPQPEHPVCQPGLSLRARRGRLTWTCSAVTVGALALLLASPWGPPYLSPGPLASHHALIESRHTDGAYCAACHQPDSRAAAILQPVTDSSCLACHAATATAHHAAHSVEAGTLTQPVDRLGAVRTARDCTHCHTDHRGRDHDLSLVHDRTCTACHADLTRWRRELASHMGEASHGLPLVHPPLDVRASDRVTSFGADHPEARVLGGHIDATPIRFEHDVHLATDDQMQQRLTGWVAALREKPGVSESLIPVRTTGEGKLALTCAACHQPDAAGRYMLPISFQTHCVQCHELGSKAVGGKDVPIPHGSAIGQFTQRVALETVAAELQSKVESKPTTDGAEKPAEVAAPPAAPAGPARRGPGGRGPGGAKPTTPKADKPFAERVAEEARKFNQRLSTTCSKCHDPAANPAEMADPKIPARWFTASIFSHQAHSFTGCAECHPQAYAPAPPAETSDPSGSAPLAALRWTGRTKQIMLPSIQTCRTCHASRTAVPTVTAVRHHCALCHKYHTPSPDLTAGGLSAHIAPPNAAASPP